MNIKYHVIVNRAAHSGYVHESDMSKIWRGLSGWTYQDITGPHGIIYDVKDTKEEADEVLRNYLKCDTDRYCYTHNSGRR